jgi:Uma2 family endonuclease
MATGTQLAEPLPPPDWDSDAARFYEVVDGRVVENPPMGAQESVLASFLHGLISMIATPNRLGRSVIETLFLIDRARDLKRRPDLAFVSVERWPLKRRVPKTEAWDVIPELIVEVISKSNTADGVLKKIDEYFEAGVSIVWVVYPVTEKVYVYESPTRVRILKLGDELDGGTVLPGFRVGLRTLFEVVDGEADATH